MNCFRELAGGANNVSAQATAVNDGMAQSPDLGAPRSAQVAAMHRDVNAAIPGGLSRLQASLKVGAPANNATGPKADTPTPGMQQHQKHEGPHQEEANEFATFAMMAAGSAMGGPAGFAVKMGAEVAHAKEAMGGQGQPQNPADAMFQGRDGRMSTDPAAQFKAPAPSRPAPDRSDLRQTRKFGPM